MPNAFSDVRLGHLTLCNRLAMAPMVTLFPEVADRPTAHHLGFYERRARGGVGLIIVGATYVSRDGKGFPNQMGIDDDEKLPPFRALATRIQRHVPALIQLFHAGPKTSHVISGADVVAPSTERLPRSARYDSSRALSGTEVRQLLVAFEAAADRAHRAGFAGIELHGANGYLLHAFSDPTSNGRRDEWSEPDRFAVTLVRGLRARFPPPFVIGYTLSPFAVGRHDADATSLEPFVGLGKALDGAGIDYLHVYRGKEERSDKTLPRVFAENLRQAGIAVPIVEGAGIRSARHAEAFLRRGATLAAIGRALLGSPDLLTRPGYEYSDAELAALSTPSGLQRAFDSEYGSATRDPGADLGVFSDSRP